MAGGGQMGNQVRNFPWQNTPLGPAEQWPASLKASVNLLLNSKFPMFIWWGPLLITIYNDAYKVILGDKHAKALGSSGPKVWSEIWDVVGPLADRVLQKGEATWSEDQLLYINRLGFIEESYFTFSYSPVYDEFGNIGGVFCACAETTDKVLITRKINKSEENLANIILHSPVAMCIFRGLDFIMEIGNEKMFELMGRSKEMLLNKPIFDSLPEARNQGFEELLDRVYRTGETYSAYGQPATIMRYGVRETFYLNFVYEAFREADESISGVMAVAIDVTPQVLHQQKIEESAQEVRSLIESAPFPIGVYTGKEMRIKLANQSILDAWGKGNDVIGKLFRDVLPELEDQAIYQKLDQVYLSGIPFHAKNQKVDLLVDGNLRSFYFNYSFVPLFNKDGEVYGVMNTAAEVTDLTVALQKFKEAEEKARLAIESAALGTFEFDYTSGGLKASERFEKDLGVQRGSGPQIVIDIIHPDDLAIRALAHELAFKTGNLFYEVRIYHDQAEMRWIRVKAKILFNDDGQPGRILGIVQDITEQKLFAEELGKQVKERTRALQDAQETLFESYQYLQHIINKFETALASLEPVFEGDTIVDFTFKMTNDGYAAYSGIQPSEIYGLKVSEVFPHYQETDAFAKYVETFTTGRTNKWDLHYNIDNLDVYLTVAASKMHDEVIVHLTDFTKLKSLQLDLMRNIEELKRSNKNLEDFAYAASHDLKEPIRKIHFFSDKLKKEIDGSLSADQLNLFSKMENATHRMGSLVDDLLTYSQVNVKPRAYDRVDLNELLNIVLSDLDLEIEQKSAVINIDELPVINGYPRQLQAVISKSAE